MPLVNSGLISELQNGFKEHHPDGDLAGKTIATAINNYIQGVTNAGAGGFTAFPGGSSLGKAIGGIFKQQLPDGQLVGLQIATEINNAMLTLQTLYQIGPPITAGGLSGFINDMKSLHGDKAASGALYGKTLADHIDKYTKQIQISGTIPGTPPVPFAGAVS